MTAILSRILATCAFLHVAAPAQSQTVESFQDWSGLYSGIPPESGWGVNVASQGKIFFISWLTYDVDGSQMWLVIPRAERVGPFKYAGPMYRARGPAFDQAPWNSDGLGVTVTQVGSGTLALVYDILSDENLQFTYTLNGVEGHKDLRIQLFGLYPTCEADGTKAVYQGLWWAGPAESGWGLHVNHQGDMVFAIWLTFDADGRGIWVVMPRGERVGNSEAFSGPLYRTTGPRFDAKPWNSAAVTATEVGQATLAFSGSGSGQFTYTLHGATQTKTISRQGAATRWTTCRTR
jgi:hypothetical protein